MSVSIVCFNLAQSLQCSAETYLPFPICCLSVPNVIEWHNSKFTCQKPGNHIFTFYLLLLSISSQFSGPLASISLIPFVVYLSVDSQQYCLISGCIRSSGLLFFNYSLFLKSYSSLPAFHIHRKPKLDHVPSIFRNLHGFCASLRESRHPSVTGKRMHSLPSLLVCPLCVLSPPTSV